MADCGFFSTQEEINEIAVSVINILNGSNDSSKLSKDQSASVKRYFPKPEQQVIMQAKNLCCDILI
jgi:hypothetical protein